MRKFVWFFLVLLACGVGAYGQQNLLANGDFETNAPTTFGNNTPITVTAWTVNPNIANVVQVDDGVHPYGSSGPQCDASVPCLQVPQHYFDVKADTGSISQDFRTRCEGKIEVGGWFSTRDNAAAPGNSIKLLDGTTVVGSQSVNLPAGTSQNGPWVHVSFVVNVLPHTYTFVATLNQNANFDNAYVHYLTPCDSSDCMTSDAGKITCNQNGTFTITTMITNHTGSTLPYLTITPPPGATYTVSPTVVPGPIANNANVPVSVTVSGATAGQSICLQYSLPDPSGKVCCSIWRCYTAPDCACMTITKLTIGCDPGPDQYQMTFNVTNNTTSTIQQIVVIPSSGTVTTPVIATNIPPGQTVPITLHLNGLTANTQLCLILQSVREGTTDCCTVQVCVTVPPIVHPCD